MSSIFEGKTGLRSQNVNTPAASFSTALSAATAFQITTLSKSCKFLYIDSTLNVDMMIALVHPDADQSVAANRLNLLEVPTNRVLSLDVSSTANLEIDPGTKLFAYASAGVAPASGKFRIFMWG